MHGAALGRQEQPRGQQLQMLCGANLGPWVSGWRINAILNMATYTLQIAKMVKNSTTQGENSKKYDIYKLS